MVRRRIKRSEIYKDETWSELKRLSVYKNEHVAKEGAHPTPETTRGIRFHTIK